MTKAEKMLEDIEAMAGNLRDEIRTTMETIAKAQQCDRLIDENRALRTTIEDLREANTQLLNEVSLAAAAKLNPTHVSREEMFKAIEANAQLRNDLAAAEERIMQLNLGVPATTHYVTRAELTKALEDRFAAHLKGRHVLGRKIIG